MSLYHLAEHLFCTELSEHCMNFIRLNLDGILALNNRKDQKLLLRFVSCEQSLIRRIQSYSREGSSKIEPGSKQEANNVKKRCERLISSLSLENCRPESLQGKLESVRKELRGLKKKINSILDIETRQYISDEQRMKICRRPVLEECVNMLEPAALEIEKKMVHYNVLRTKIKDNINVVTDEVHLEKRENDSTRKPITSTKSKYFCGVCNVSCPDENTLAFHLTGKRHRNRLKKMDEEDTAATVKALKEQNKKLVCSDSYKLKWASVPNVTSETTSFQQILQEEKKTITPLKATAKSKSSKVDRSSPNKMIWSTSPVPIASKYSGRNLIKSDSKKKKSSPWEQRPVSGSTRAYSESEQIQQRQKSFQDILREEEQKKVSEDNRGLTSSKWFLEKRDRADSMAAILEEESKMEKLIEEQLLIEAQIKIQIQVRSKSLEVKALGEKENHVRKRKLLLGENPRKLQNQ